MEIKVQYKGQLAAENDSSNEVINCEKPLSILELLNVILLVTVFVLVTYLASKEFTKKKIFLKITLPLFTLQ